MPEGQRYKEQDANADAPTVVEYAPLLHWTHVLNAVALSAVEYVPLGHIPVIKAHAPGTAP